MKNKLFKNHGVDGYQLTDQADKILDEKMDSGEGLTGEEASAFLATKFAFETHGNYDAGTLFDRAELHKKYNIIIKKNGKTSLSKQNSKIKHQNS